MSEQVKKRIFFIIAAAICALGVWGTLTRKDPIEKNIGYVYLRNGDDVQSLNGYKAETLYKGKSKKYDYPALQSKSDEIPVIVVTEENSGNISVSYSDDNYKTAYNLYNSEFNPISENSERLELPSETGELYYIEASVVWGSDKENVTMKYYFSIKT